MSDKGETMIESVNAITLATHDMARAVLFYRALGFTAEGSVFEEAGIDHVRMVLNKTQ